jgi:hypothetical protein
VCTEGYDEKESSRKSKEHLGIKFVVRPQHAEETLGSCCVDRSAVDANMLYLQSIAHRMRKGINHYCCTSQLFAGEGGERAERGR